MLPHNELDIVEQATKTDIYDYFAGKLDKYRAQVKSEAAKEILTRHEVYLYHKEEGRDI